ncbi:MAG TPA: GspE/PulE family protein [Patescibacteria group bacterium]|nr:GspE/PulE family protein [Patescibacteria group bacterium]
MFYIALPMLITDDQLKELVLKTGLAANQQVIDDVSQFAKDTNITFQDALIERDIATDENVGILIADFLHIPFIVLAKLSIPEDLLHLVPEKTARKQKIIPFAKDADGIKVAMADPTNTEIQEAIAKKTNLRVIPYLTTERDIENTLRIFKRDLQTIFEDLIKHESEQTGLSPSDEAPIEKIVTLLIEFAYQDKTSDVHIEPQEKNSLVRFRIDGILHDVLVLPKNYHERVISRIKILSRLRTDEHLAPQDGKMRAKLDEEDLDIRVSILPIADGEKAVLRLLASKFRQFSLIDLGMSEEDLKKVTAAYNKSFGMVLSTGPTGSGKTTSIYSILKIINTREKNITTIEDPVEYRIKGVNQIQVNVKANLTFASGLRSILRQDPNVVFVGEIRDGETAGIAVNAALTGHLVVSTLHTNDAATSLPRLIDMGIEPFLVASTVNVIIAQRLIRRICDMCKATYTIPITEITKYIPVDIVRRHFGDKHDISVFRGQGCKVCRFTGYTGRLGVFEVLEVTKEIRKLITQKYDSDVISRKAIEEGMTTMLEDGLNKVTKGITTIEEVLRVTKVESL